MGTCFHDLFLHLSGLERALCFTIPLFISPDLDGYEASYRHFHDMFKTIFKNTSATYATRVEVMRCLCVRKNTAWSEIPRIWGKCCGLADDSSMPARLRHDRSSGNIRCQH